LRPPRTFVRGGRIFFMKVATFNVNSIRRRLPAVLDWLSRNKPDVMCLQETKVEDALFPRKDIEAAGYHVVYRGMKTFNGVATITKKMPDNVSYGFTDGKEVDDFRLILIHLDGIPILNTYVPQGTDVEGPKFEYKLTWFKRLRSYFQRHFDPGEPVMWMGDLNVAPEPIDVYAPERLEIDPDYHPAARKAYKETVSWGFEDVYRRLYPDTVQYTYWDFFRNHFQRNRGWRIDHIMATPPLAACVKKVEVDLGPRRAPNPSDHTILWAEFDLSRLSRKRN
jgi:exodeoxyribonuclease III